MALLHAHRNRLCFVGGFYTRDNTMKLRVFISYTSRDNIVSNETLSKARSLFSEYSSVYIDRLSGKSKWHPQLVILSKVFRAHLVVVIESRSVYYSL